MSYQDMFTNKKSTPHSLLPTPYIIFLCIAGIYLNRIFATLVFYWIPLPLYLDTVMTITVTLLAGPVFGTITGALTNIIALIFNFHGIEFLLFSLCNIATAIITWFFIRLFPRELNFTDKHKSSQTKTSLISSRFNKVMDTIIVLTILSLALCLAMSIMGGLIAYFIAVIRGEATHPEVSAHLHMFGSETPLVLQEILSRIPVNIIDRLISVFLGFGIALLVRRLFSCKISRCFENKTASDNTRFFKKSGI